MESKDKSYMALKQVNEDFQNLTIPFTISILLKDKMVLLMTAPMIS